MVTSRILFTAKQKDELWERWKNGQSVLAISRAVKISHAAFAACNTGSACKFAFGV